ncbi:ABC transporter ATP-binding protein [Vibrio sp. JC009]|uniref:ABC transporter ATP-binding protein n=1 Tax=Vibrio sp. JC009 TaxID=2912314 RepID=UPI0023AECA8B|nr:ABC transporter ATP-binding protein [Vibrio sp. JC009]WED22122.1 ABC transporter ATP-binding protein [Vibrio sp. JC009]
MSSSEPVVSLADISFRWNEKQPPTLIFDQLNIQKKEHIFIKGPSGSGKSTLLSLLTGIISPQQGKVSILGQDISTLKSNQRDSFRADHIGYIFQQFNLLPYLSVIENVLLPCHFSKKRKSQADGDIKANAVHLLKRLRLTDDLLEKPVVELSIGQQQRVAAARALIGRPEILIADEPTSALDFDNRCAFIELLMEEAEKAGSTLIFVSHDPTLESMFERTINLNELNHMALSKQAEVIR